MNRLSLTPSFVSSEPRSFSGGSGGAPTICANPVRHPGVRPGHQPRCAGRRGRRADPAVPRSLNQREAHSLPHVPTGCAAVFFLSEMFPRLHPVRNSLF